MKKVYVMMFENKLGQDVNDRGGYEVQKMYRKGEVYPVHPKLAENLESEKVCDVFEAKADAEAAAAQFAASEEKKAAAEGQAPKSGKSKKKAPENKSEG